MGCFAFVVVVVLVLAICTYYLLVSGDDGTEALRAKGYPTTLEELDAWYPEPPVGENAAEYYIQGGTALNQSDFPDLAALPFFGGGDFPPPGTRMSEEMLSTIALFLDHEALAFQLIDEASQFEGSRDPGFNRLGASSIMEWLKAMQGQRLRTRYYSSLGNTDATLEQLGKLAHLARSRGQASSEGFMLFDSFVRNTVSTIEHIVNENDLSREQFDEVDRLLEQLLLDEALVRDIVATRCRTLALIDSPQPFHILSGYARSSFVDEADAFLAVAEGGLPDQLNEYRKLRDRDFFPFQVFASIFSTSFNYSVQSFYAVQTRVSVARLAIAVQRYRLEGGELPEDWDAVPNKLKEVWPIDPFSGEPIRYKRSDEGFIVYGVGANFEDDGGNWEQNLDTVFRVLR